MTPAEWFALIEEHAPKLRAVGVVTLTLDGFTVQLTQHDPREALEDVRHRVVDPILDAMNDPETFGGSLPGYRIPLPDEEV